MPTEEQKVKLIGAGLPRTATLTQRAALEILGLAPCYHMQNVFADMSAVGRWRDVLDGRLSAAEILDGYPAMVDWPGSYYYRELMEAYPDAKVLLSVRDGMSWAQSMQKTIWGLFYDDTLIRHVSDARMKVDPIWNTYIEMMKEMWIRTELLDGEGTTLEYMAAAMERFNDEVRAAVPAERLLEWSPMDGWKPLCAFLELPVPDEPIPHINDTAQFVDQITRFSVQVLSDKVLDAGALVTQ
jgi:Sulfotransferase domain